MLCSRSASLTSSTRMSSDMASRNLRRFSAARSLSLCASIRLSLVTPSTIRATFSPNSRRISSGVATVSSIVSWRIAGGDRLVVEVEIGEDARDFDRVAEIGVARRALLVPVRIDREDIGAVEQGLVGWGS